MARTGYYTNGPREVSRRAGLKYLPVPRIGHHRDSEVQAGAIDRLCVSTTVQSSGDTEGEA